MKRTPSRISLTLLSFSRRIGISYKSIQSKFSVFLRKSSAPSQRFEKEQPITFLKKLRLDNPLDAIAPLPQNEAYSMDGLTMTSAVSDSDKTFFEDAMHINYKPPKLDPKEEQPMVRKRGKILENIEDFDEDNAKKYDTYNAPCSPKTSYYLPVDAPRRPSESQYSYNDPKYFPYTMATSNPPPWFHEKGFGYLVFESEDTPGLCKVHHCMPCSQCDPHFNEKPLRFPL